MKEILCDKVPSRGCKRFRIVPTSMLGGVPMDGGRPICFVCQAKKEERRAVLDALRGLFGLGPIFTEGDRGKEIE